MPFNIIRVNREEQMTERINVSGKEKKKKRIQFRIEQIKHIPSAALTTNELKKNCGERRLHHCEKVSKRNYLILRFQSIWIHKTEKNLFKLFY